MTEAQITSVTTALTSAANTILSDFISLLPVFAAIVGVIFAIKFIKARFGKLERVR